MQVVLIGLGMVADMQAAALRATGGNIRLAGIHTRTVERMQEFADRQDGRKPRLYTSLAEIADDPDIDFVIVATPPNARREIVECLADAGKGILLEKPIERTFSNARSLVEYCAAAGVNMGVILQHRMRPAAQQLHNILASGALGEIATVETNVPWWRPPSYYDVEGRGTYARDGGGVLITQGIHTLDLMLSFAGPVAQVQALTATSALHDMEGEDFASAGLVFKSGALGSVMATTASYPGRSEQIVLNCTKGTAVLNATTLSIHHRSGKVEKFGEVADTGGGSDPMAFTHEWHQLIIEDFADSMTIGGEPFVTGREALHVQALIDAIQMSSTKGRIVDVDRDIVNV
jgi:UDP-N-acetyl-2-amino-2-deoxyglucuronate dehydrogenase